MVNRKVAFVIPYLGSGGAERVVTTLANELVKTHNVSIITYTKMTPFYKLDSEINLFHCQENIHPSKNIFQAINTNYNLIKSLIKITRENQFNLLLGFLTSANVLSILTSKICGNKVIISERNNPERDKITRFWSILRRISYPLANHVIVQTIPIKAIISRYVNQKKISILPNPINPELSDARKKVFKRNNHILSVGRLTDQKNHELLIRAFHMTGAKNWELLIVGDGENRKSYEKLIKKLKIENLVKLPGQTRDVSKYYNSASIFAFSSNYEGFPNALIEAMHFGLACISTNCPTGPSELIEDGINGLLVRMNDVKIMSEKLNLLMNDDHTIQSLGQNAAASVKKFELNTVVQQWEKLIEDCLANKNF